MQLEIKDFYYDDILNEYSTYNIPGYNISVDE